MSDDDLIKQALATLARAEARATPPFTRCLRPRPAALRRRQWRVGVAVAAALVSVVIGWEFLLRPAPHTDLSTIALPLETLVASLDPELMSGTPDFDSALRLAREFAKREVRP